MNWIDTAFGSAQQWLFESVVQPFMFALGMGNLLEDGYTATGWLLVGLLQIAAIRSGIIVFAENATNDAAAAENPTISTRVMLAPLRL